MSDQININRKPKGYIIFLSWLFLVILPVFIFDFALNKLFEITKQTNLKLSREELITEMRRFKDEMDMSSFLNHELDIFYQKHGEAVLDQSAENLAGIFKVVC